MKILNHRVEIVEQKPGIEGIYKNIERAGRLCYASTPVDESGKKFYDRMVELGHLGVIEHGVVYLRFKMTESKPASKYIHNHYSVINKVVDPDKNDIGNVEFFVTTNMRVLVENNFLDDLKYLCDKPTKYHTIAYSVIFHTDRITGESFIRHRTIDGLPVNIDDESFSYCRQSTRYCNYANSKFDSSVSFVVPTGISEEFYNRWVRFCSRSEKEYMAAISDGIKPEQARYLLGFSVYSPLMMTAKHDDWNKFFKLRCDSHAHPDARHIANIAKNMIDNM